MRQDRNFYQQSNGFVRSMKRIGKTSFQKRGSKHQNKHSQKRDYLFHKVVKEFHKEHHRQEDRK